jgi:hypothetical protein
MTCCGASTHAGWRTRDHVPLGGHPVRRLGVGAPLVVVCVLLANRVFGASFWTIVYAASIGVLITTRVITCGASTTNARP